MEILSSQIVNVDGVTWMFTFGFILFAIGFISLVTNSFSSVEYTEFTVISILGILSIIFGIYTMKKDVYVKETYTEYKVIIKKDANFNEIMSKYEILGQEGKIYTIKERNDK